MELYLIRHGQTDWNKEERLQGSIDIQLNENGRSMAVLASQRLKDVHFDRIFSSPLSRAYVTAEIICGERTLPIEVDQRLKEISFGEKEGCLYTDWKAPDSPYRYFFSMDEADKYFPPPGGESIEHLNERTKEFVQTVIEPLAQTNQRIMIVAHGALLASVMCYLENRTKKHFWGDGLRKNCQETIFTYDCASKKWIKL